MRTINGGSLGVEPLRCNNVEQMPADTIGGFVDQSTIRSFISSLFPCNSGAYIALAFAGSAL